jgi:rare lipoprotein A
MAFSTRSRLRRASSLLAIGLSFGFVAACASPQPKGMVANKQQRSKEYFAESEYGVKASPRVTNQRSNLKRGGGRDQTGRPYKVRGKMYYPKEEKNYRKTGLASWYGDAFHGRLTANGEIYDKTHLTAAHPTMPLPSYARVTNLKNGSSVIVRVNDRGPYSHGRLIDLSQRAAEMLDYTHSGTANVKVAYVGRAPLDGRDDSYLMASYKPGKGAADPSDGLPTGVMIAMNGPTPSADIDETSTATPFPGVMADAAAPAVAGLAMTASFDSGAALPGDLDLPAFGPIAPERPAFDPLADTQIAFATMSYAEHRVARAADAFAVLEKSAMSSADIAESWKRLNGASASETDPFVAAGSFTDRAEADRLAQTLSAYGKTVLETSQEEGVAIHSVNLFADGRNSLDAMLEAAWDNGAPDAIAVRD